MATIVLSALGTLIGGPIGGTLGSLIGSQVDREIFKPGANEGPKLKELALTTSSYGQAIPRHYGRMRSAGSIIWSTDLIENRDKSGGGKGKPSTVTYSYTVSLAIALASRPITSVGRIWADGNLLRGQSGKLKTGGTMRMYTGRGDQPVDPLLASAIGEKCPAYRGCAYVVFEDLQLAEYGNRIPALTFEVIADRSEFGLSELVGGGAVAGTTANRKNEGVITQGSFAGLEGYSHDGATIAGSLAVIDAVYPLSIDVGADRLALSTSDTTPSEPVIVLSPAVPSSDEGDFGAASGQLVTRGDVNRVRPSGLRYYDTGRDYQPGTQRAEGQSEPGRDRTIDFPGALSADNARALAEGAAQRSGWRGETLKWRLAELRADLRPGSLVTAPGHAGTWRVTGWEWRERGVELDLERVPPIRSARPSGETGAPVLQPDYEPWPTQLRLFELPWDGSGNGNVPSIYAAVSAASSEWNGTALFVDRAGELVPLGGSGRSRNIMGVLQHPLGPSKAMVYEELAFLDVKLAAEDAAFASASVAGLAEGANRLLVGDEVWQFAAAAQIGPALWRLSGLLRGRGGTEHSALNGHLSGAAVIFIDNTLRTFDPAEVPAVPETTIAAIGTGEEEPVTAKLSNAGLSLTPLTPVHPRIARAADGTVALCWTRRARGQYRWRDGVDTPLVEQLESYRVGVGPVARPVAEWIVTEPRLDLTGQTFDSLQSAYPAQTLWVRQIGDFAQSSAAALHTFD